MNQPPNNEDSDASSLPVSQVDPEDLPQAVLVIEETQAAAETQGAIRSGKLAGKSMWAAIWILAIPVLFQQTMAACVGLIDKMIAGSLPSDIVVPALDGISIGSYVGWLIGIAMTGVGIGGQALIARSMGSGNRDEAHRSLGQSVTVSFAWGAVVGVALYFLADPLASLARLDESAAMYCRQYVQTIAYSMPFFGLMMVGHMCLHGAGETTKPALIALKVNIVNIVASWALSGADLRFGSFTLINPFSIDWHVYGIAAGTAIAYLYGGLATLATLRRGVKDLRLEGRDLTFDGSMVRRIVRIGIPSFLEGISMWGVNLFVLIFIGHIAHKARAEGLAGEGFQGAHVIAVQWEAFSFLPGFAIGTAAGALAGQYLGAKNPRMAARAILACTGIGMVVMGLLGVVFMLFGRALTSVISNNDVHLEHVPNLLFICGTVQIFFALAMVIRQGLRGCGDANWIFVITTVSSYGIRLPAAWYFGVHLGWGLEGIWIGLCGELVIRATLFLARFLHGGWKRIKV